MAEKKNIAISLIETNKGQIEGVPANPRTIKDKKFKKLVASIEQNPEMLDLRELLVYQHGDKYVIIGGNMRYEACKKLGYKELPCKVIPAETDAGTLCAYVVKDNGGYGEWDFDALANEWDESLLDVAGIDLPCMDERGELLQDVLSADHKNLEDFYKPVYFAIVSFETEKERDEWEDANKENLMILV